MLLSSDVKMLDNDSFDIAAPAAQKTPSGETVFVDTYPASLLLQPIFVLQLVLRSVITSILVSNVITKPIIEKMAKSIIDIVPDLKGVPNQGPLLAEFSVLADPSISDHFKSTGQVPLLISLFTN